MNLENRIKKLEVLVAALPEVNKAHIEALQRFLESGDVYVLPEECVSRSEALMVVREIAPEDADGYPGLAVIAEAMTSERLWGDVRLTTASATAALAVLHRLNPTDPPLPVVYCAEFGAEWLPGHGHNLLAGLGLIQLFRIVHHRETPFPKAEPKTDGL